MAHTDKSTDHQRYQAFPEGNVNLSIHFHSHPLRQKTSVDIMRAPGGKTSKAAV